MISVTSELYAVPCETAELLNPFPIFAKWAISTSIYPSKNSCEAPLFEGKSFKLLEDMGEDFINNLNHFPEEGQVDFMAEQNQAIQNVRMMVLTLLKYHPKRISSSPAFAQSQALDVTERKRPPGEPQTW